MGINWNRKCQRGEELEGRVLGDIFKFVHCSPAALDGEKLWDLQIQNNGRLKKWAGTMIR